MGAADRRSRGGVGLAVGGGVSRRREARASRRARVGAALRRFWRIAWDANITGLSAMLAYNMLLAVVPLALLALFVGGQVLRSSAVQHSVLVDLRDVFPGSTEDTLNDLLNQIRDSTTSTGVLALIACLWLGSSFWGALDTAFSRIYACASRPWLQQKRFALAMLLVVLLFMIATVTVPAAESILRAGEKVLPFDLAHVTAFVYAVSLGAGVLLMFFCLAVIYRRVPNRPVPWRAVWPGALGAAVAIAAVAYAFPAYLTSISTIARFGTTIVFVLIVLGWFYLLALIILAGGVLNAMRAGVDAVSVPAGGD